MNKLFFIVISLFYAGCKTTKTNTTNSQNSSSISIPQKYGETITQEELKTHLYIYASDEFEGRNTGEPGQKKAVAYLKDFYITNNISSPLGNANYFQEVPSEFLSNNRSGLTIKDSENVVAFIEGSEKPEEVIVISAHLDHEGVKFGQVYNGADDDGSGTVAILEIAQAFKKAVEEGNGPKRSILFLHVTGEEKGLLGSRFYTENPIFPLSNTVTNLNIDMIGRTDKHHKKEEDRNYVYLIGTKRLSTDLHNVSEEVNKKYMNINLDYRYNGDHDPNRFYYRSDHYNFAKNNIPVIFYFNGTHKDYHKPSDTPDKINYDLLENRARLIFYTAWEIANKKERLVLDEITK